MQLRTVTLQLYIKRIKALTDIGGSTVRLFKRSTYKMQLLNSQSILQSRKRNRFTTHLKPGLRYITTDDSIGLDA